MTITESQSDMLLDYGSTAAQAVLSGIPGAETWTVEPTDPVTTPPPRGARAVGTTLGSMTLVLIAHADLAAQLQGDEAGPEPLVDACRPLLLAASAATAPLHGGAKLEMLSEVDLATATSPVPGQVSVAVALIGDGSHQGALVLHVPATSEPSAHSSPEEDHGGAQRTATTPGLELLHDVEMEVTAELGRARMLVREILELAPGSVIELDRAAGSPVDVLVNGTLIARGEVVVIDEEFGIRITEVVGYQESRSH